MNISYCRHIRVTFVYYTVYSDQDEKGEKAMKCIACGREMADRGTHYECPNILCDYSEDIVDHRELWAGLTQEPPRVAVKHCDRGFMMNY